MSLQCVRSFEAVLWISQLSYTKSGILVVNVWRCMCGYGMRWEIMVQDIPSRYAVCILLEFCGDGSGCIVSVVARQAFLCFSLRQGFSHLAMQNHLTQSWQRWWTPSLKEAGPESLCELQWILGRSWRLHCLGMWVKFLIWYGWWLCLKLCNLDVSCVARIFSVLETRLH